ncbi:MAG TPA: fasciclin domain-containing protein [Thermoleophilaceae bacterium]|nr:fasciclin domain-containing protein [Thermoleophilaceae bacterium]
MKSIRIALAVVSLAALAVTGSASAASSPAGAAQEADIVQTAVGAGKFKTLTKLLKRAHLVRTLKQPRPYTVFAPTDAAFAKVPQRTLNALLRSRSKLRSVLLYHVAARELPAAAVVQRSSVKTLNGKRVRIRVRDSNVFLNNARVVTPDVMASNGVIHVINRVLIPR